MPKKPQHKKKPIRNTLEDQATGPGIDEPSELVEEEEKKYKKRDIQSNWEKYKLDTSVDNIEDEETSANDFKSLLNSTHTVSSAFKFKFERNWEKELEELQPFQLNINLQALSAGLACIPFYERIGLDPSEFSEEDLKKCDTYANKCFNKYETTKQTYFKLDEEIENSNRISEKNTQSFKSLKQQSDTSNSSNNKREIKIIAAGKENSSVPILKSVDEEEIGEHFKNVSLEHELSDSRKKSCISQQKVVNDENLEDWLDSVLDT